MLSSITEKGEIESTFAPLVVLVIYANIHVVGLMLYLVNFRQVQQWRGMDKRTWNPFKNAKDKDWQRIKTLHFWFSDPRSH